MPATAHATFPGANGKIAFERGGDIYTMNPDGSDPTVLVPKSTLGGCTIPRWSPDGQKLALDCNLGVGGTWFVDADGSNPTQFPLPAAQLSWAPDGQRVVYNQGASCNPLSVANADGTGATEILSASDAPCTKGLPVWSPRGDLIAFRFGSTLHTIKPDGTDLTQIGSAGTNEPRVGPDWSPAGDRILFVGTLGGIYTIDADGSHVTEKWELSNTRPQSAVWSPDGTEIAFRRLDRQPDFSFGPEGIWKVNDAGRDLAQLTTGDDRQPNWQPLPPLPPVPAAASYARPKGASPVTVFLVPAYEQCTSPDAAHGSPLAFPSCRSPRQVSRSLTVGTPDSNGSAANARGRVDFKTVVGNSSTPADEADVLLKADITDVRCAQAWIGSCADGAMSDFAGSLALVPTIRITDRYNGGTSRDTATATDWLNLLVPIPCAGTASTSVGSACTVETTVEAIYPGAVREGQRAIWELGQVTVIDNGIDDGNVDSYVPFLVQGVFVP
jgi:hypothetical protein